MPPSLPERKARRWFRFSLRTFCLVVLAFSVLLGAFTWRWNRGRRQAAAVEKLWKTMYIDARYQLYSEPFPPPEKPWLQTKLEPWLGRDFFESVVMIDSMASSEPDGDTFYALALDCPRVQHINVPTASLQGKLHHLSALPLRKLVLRGDKLEEHDLQAIGRLTQLQGLYLYAGFDSRHLRHLSSLQKLTEVGLSDSLTDEGWKAMNCPSTLVELRLSKSRITDESLQSLQRFPQLRELDLNETSITSAGARYIASCPKLVKLDLEETQVDDDALVAIGQCHLLESLDLDKTRVSDAGLRHLHELRALKWLDLRGTSVRGDGLASLAGRASLTNLYLGGAPHFAATSACLPHVAKMNLLFQFGIESNSITAADLAATRWPASLSYAFLGVKKVDEPTLLAFSHCKELIQIDIPRDGLPQNTIVKLEQQLQCTIVDQLDTGEPAEEPAPMPNEKIDE